MSKQAEHRWNLYLKVNGCWDFLQTARDFHEVQKVEARFTPGAIKRVYRGADIYLVNRKK